MQRWFSVPNELNQKISKNSTPLENNMSYFKQKISLLLMTHCYWRLALVVRVFFQCRPPAQKAQSSSWQCKQLVCQQEGQSFPLCTSKHWRPARAGKSCIWVGTGWREGREGMQEGVMGWGMGRWGPGWVQWQCNDWGDTGSKQQLLPGVILRRLSAAKNALQDATEAAPEPLHHHSGI